ncbi:unnamed protein product [Cuscuta epithymum]|uniref:SWIM-type domain-containing protein n=1 Tax=Cuscuta epithymum TaxID=186058 RepID=A0AAV0CLA3_9ASTE|nr:unnamed protein product [Cuscuta epithymum]
MPALYETFPDVEHRRCARHIYAIWRRGHPGIELQRAFWKCCKSASKREFEANLECLKSLSASAHEDILKVDPKFWCRAFFNRSIKCETVDNNLCEAFNGVIVPARSLLGYSQLEYMRKLVMQRLNKNRELGHKWIGQLGPRIRRRINKTIQASNYWRVQFNGADGYEVSCGSETYLVDLDNRSCLCEQWDVSGIPCKHAICAIRDRVHPIEDYVSLWYKKEMYTHTYSEMMTPIAGPLFWPKTDLKVLPAELKTKEMGRPRKNRIKEIGEFASSGKLPKRGTAMTCQLCFKKGHNKKGCPSKEVIMQGSTTFPSEIQGDSGNTGVMDQTPPDVQPGSSNPPKRTCGNCSQPGHTKNRCPNKNILIQESNTASMTTQEENGGPSRLQAYLCDTQGTIETTTNGVFEFRGQRSISAQGLERLRARKAKERNVNAQSLRKRHAEDVEPTGTSTTARQRFNELYDSMEGNAGQ